MNVIGNHPYVAVGGACATIAGFALSRGRVRYVKKGDITYKVRLMSQDKINQIYFRSFGDQWGAKNK